VDVYFDLLARYPVDAINWEARRTPPSLSEAAERFPGALVGGITIGLIELFAGRYLPHGFKDVAAYVVVLVVLVVRPSGIFAEMRRKKV
jgi:branched-chain amino acid transport system permease protein